MTGPAPGHEAGPAVHRAPSPVRWLSAPSLRLHAALVAGLAGSAAATWFEWSRARAGHQVAWVYTFEWPLFALLGSYLWWRLLHAGQEAAARSTAAGPAESPGEPGTDAPVSVDAELVAWRAYLDRLHETDPPGGPPAGRR